MNQHDVEHCATIFIGRLRANMVGDTDTVQAYDSNFDTTALVGGGVQLMINMALIQSGGCASRAGAAIATVVTTRVSDELLVPACDVFRSAIDALTDAPCGEECVTVKGFAIMPSQMPATTAHVQAVEETVQGFIDAYTYDEADDVLSVFSDVFLAQKAHG